MSIFSRFLRNVRDEFARVMKRGIRISDDDKRKLQRELDALKPRVLVAIDEAISAAYSHTLYAETAEMMVRAAINREIARLSIPDFAKASFSMAISSIDINFSGLENTQFALQERIDIALTAVKQKVKGARL